MVASAPGRGFAVVAVWVLLAACSNGSPGSIEAGDYQFYTIAAEDECLDGALEALFMPEGRDEEHPFEFPVYVPSIDETPLSYQVDFREPFLGMPVTVEETSTGLAIRGSVMEAVLLNEPQYGDCVATMHVDADLLPGDDLSGEARIDVSDPRGDEGRCPTFQADPCRATLTIRADRIGPGDPELL